MQDIQDRFHLLKAEQGDEDHQQSHYVNLFYYQLTQLIGFSDPLYAGAYVNMNQYDIVLNMLIVNQARKTLQACTLELAALLVTSTQAGRQASGIDS